MEQGTGVEPASEAWEATIIADILTLHGLYYNKERWKIQVFFVSEITRRGCKETHNHAFID